MCPKLLKHWCLILEQSMQFMQTIIYEISVCGCAYEKKSDITPFVIINIFKSNCNLITHFFLVTVTNYNYIYFVIKLRNLVTCN